MSTENTLSVADLARDPAISHIIHWLYSINQYWLLAIAYVVSIS